MTTLFLFGAGASYGSEDFIPRGGRPPLGNGPNGLFRELQRLGGVASTVDAQLANTFERNFEVGMGEFFETRNREVMRFLREMALYFTRFSAGPNNLYTQVISTAEGVGAEIVLSTTNYDLLLEMAAGHAGYLVSHRRHPLPPGRISVLKVHGSIHFLLDLEGEDTELVDCHIDTSQLLPGSAAFSAPVRLASGNEEVRHYCLTQTSVAPAIAMYARGKPVFNSPGYVARQQEHWRAEVARADDIVIVGLRANDDDDHIWGVLGEAPARLHFVGGEPEEFGAWAENARHPRAEPKGKTFRDALPEIERILRAGQKDVGRRREF